MNGLLLSQLHDNETLLYNLQNVHLFFLNPSRPTININLPIFNAVEAFSFTGKLVATNWETLQILKKTNAEKIYYVRELEWMKKPDFYENRVVHYEPTVKIVANSEYVKENLKLWGVEANIIREVEFSKIYE